MYCNKCGMYNNEGVKFCGHCGAGMGDASSSQKIPFQRDQFVEKHGMNPVVTVIICTSIVAVVILLFMTAMNRWSGNSSNSNAGRGAGYFGSQANMAMDKSTCQNNLKELGIAIALYYGDFDAALPSSILYGGSKTWDSNDFKYYAGKRGTIPPPATITQTWPMLLYPYMRNKEIIWCPSDPGRREDPNAVVSYFWKAAVDCAWYGGPAGKGPVCQKEGDYDFPADQVILYEHNGWHWGDENRGLTDSVTINCLFLDGHVAAKRIVNSGYTTTENPPEPMPQSGMGEPAWFNYDFANSSAKSITGALWNPQQYGDNLP